MTLFTQVHCIEGGKVLLMRRRKEPNLGLWVAPGGKVEKDEAPYECAVRELREETGLAAHSAELYGIVSLIMPKLEAPMIHFLFVVSEFSGSLITDNREGELCWHKVDEVSSLAMPTANAIFLPHVLNQKKAFYQAKYTYDAQWRLLNVDEHELIASST